MVKETDKFKKHPKLTIKFANTVFVLGVLLSVLIIIYALYKKFNPPPFADISDIFYYTFFLLGGISTILFAFGLRLNQ